MLGLRTTIYKVSNLKKAKEWYTAAFLTPPYFDEPFYVGFNIGGYELGLQPGAPSNQTTNDQVVAYWGVDDLEATYTRLLNLGATEHEKPRNVGGALLTASVYDPFGNPIGLIYNPDFAIKHQ